MISKSYSSAIQRKTSLSFSFISLFSTFFRYFGIHTKWYLSSYIACPVLLNSLMPYYIIKGIPLSSSLTFAGRRLPRHPQGVGHPAAIFVKRIIDAYHKISLDKLTFKVHKAPLRKQVELRISPDEKTGLADARIWHKDILTDVYQVRNSDFDSVRL